MDHRNGHNNSYTNLRRSQSNNMQQTSQEHDWPPRRRQITMQSNNRVEQPPPQQQHDELIRYIKDAWHKVNEPGQHGNGPCFYRSDYVRPPPGFTPFDLEGYWGQRLVQKIHVNSSGHQ